MARKRDIKQFRQACKEVGLVCPRFRRHLTAWVERLGQGGVDAKKAYPDVLHVEIRDSAGELWRLATQDAE